MRCGAAVTPGLAAALSHFAAEGTDLRMLWLCIVYCARATFNLCSFDLVDAGS